MTIALFAIAAWACRSEGDAPSDGPGAALPWHTVAGTPFSVEGLDQVETKPITVSFPPKLSFAMPMHDLAPELTQPGERVRRVLLPSSKHRGGSVHVYWAKGSRADPRDPLAVLQIIERETKIERQLLRRMVADARGVSAYSGKTPQGFPYAYYRFNLEPARRIIAVQPPDGLVVLSGGGYLRMDTIPSSFRWQSQP